MRGDVIKFLKYTDQKNDCSNRVDSFTKTETLVTSSFLDHYY